MNNIKVEVIFFFGLYISIYALKFHIRHVFISLLTMKLKGSKKIVFPDEAKEGNLRKVFIEATDKSKYDSLTFLKFKEETIRSILRKERIKRKGIKFYPTLQVRFTKTKGDQVEVTEPHLPYTA